MSKHAHHETKFHYDPYQTTKQVSPEGVATIADDKNSCIRIRAYQIHVEKGGSDLDNWLEAERQCS